jgi:pimeloyl-ACP methyl ester carboxylesterase
LPESAFADVFAPNAAAGEQALLAAVQRPISVNCIGAAVERPLWKDCPSWFLIAEEDRMIGADTERFTAVRMGARARSLPVDHTPMVTAPQDVADIIRDAVADVLTPA